MNDQGEVIILKVSDFKENDAILNVLSREYGKLSFMARGLRKIKSKNVSNCSLFNMSRFYFDYNEQRSMHVLKTAENIHNFRKVREDLLKQSIASIMVEAMDKMNLEELDRAFTLLEKSLILLDQTDNSIALFGLYLAKCCELSGIRPFVDGCVLCGKENHLVGISQYDGGFVCDDCFDISRHQKREKATLKFFRLLNKANMDQFTFVEEIPCTYKDLEDVLHIFMEYSGITLKSLTFFKHILDMNA